MGKSTVVATDMELIEGMPSPSVMLYSHDGFGLGHLSRTLYLARHIRERIPAANILVVTSSPATHRFRALDDFEYVKLPSVTKSGAERYHPHRLHASLESIVALRSDLLLKTVQHVRPDLFIVDHRPLGLKGEVTASLRWLRDECPDARTVVGLRDVVDESQTVIADWTKHGIYAALEELFDHILIYGDSAVLNVVETYAMAESLARKVQFTGYLGRGKPLRSRDAVRRSLGLKDERLVVVHSGGGGDGLPLMSAYLQCVETLPADVYSLVVTGPLMTVNQREELLAMAPRLRGIVVDYQEDLASCIAAADLSISMAGYNTVCEVLSAGVPAIVVPRIFPRTEQAIRARHLAERGLVDVLPSTSLSPQTLVASIMRRLQSPTNLRRVVDLDGGRRAGDFLASLLPSEEMGAVSWA